MDAVSAFAGQQLNQIVVRPESREDGSLSNHPLRESMVAESVSQSSDMTVLPEEVCVVSIGSDDSVTARLRKEKALKRKRDLHEQ